MENVRLLRNGNENKHQRRLRYQTQSSQTMLVKLIFSNPKAPETGEYIWNKEGLPSLEEDWDGEQLGRLDMQKGQTHGG